MILMDTGPLVSLFDPKDSDHKNCHIILNKLSEPMLTTEAVLTEVFHLLDPASRGSEGFKEFLVRDYITLESLTKSMVQRCFEFMDKYADLPMDFADATLLVLAEKHRSDKVFTLDFQDFRTYQIKKGYRHYPLNLLGSELLEFTV